MAINSWYISFFDSRHFKRTTANRSGLAYESDVLTYFVFTCRYSIVSAAWYELFYLAEALL